MQDNVLLAAGLGAAVLGGLFLVLTSKRKDPVRPGPGRLRCALRRARRLLPPEPRPRTTHDGRGMSSGPDDRRSTVDTGVPGQDAPEGTAA